MTEPLVVEPADRPEPLQIAGFEITTIASTEQTGNYEVFHQAGPAGKGPGPHFHDWDESFLVVSGTLECGVDGNDLTAVWRAAGEAIERARCGEGPSFIQADTYRLRGHIEIEAGFLV